MRRVLDRTTTSRRWRSAFLDVGDLTLKQLGDFFELGSYRVKNVDELTFKCRVDETTQAVDDWDMPQGSTPRPMRENWKNTLSKVDKFPWG